MTIDADFAFPAGIGLTVSTDDVEAADFFRAEYGWAMGSRPREAGATIALDWSRHPLPILESAAGHYHQHKLLARWRYAVELTNERVKLSAVGTRHALPMVHHMMVHPSLRWLASQRDRLLLHGSALVHSGRSVIFTGQGGAGKTTTSSILLAAGDPGWQLHADDYTFLARDGRTEAYLTRAHLYRDLLNWVPEVRERLTASEKVGLAIFGRVRKWTGDRVKWPVRVELERLWPERSVARQATLGGVFLLSRTEASSPMAERIQQRDETLDELLTMNFREARHYIDLLEAVLPTSRMADLLETWRSNERSVLEAAWDQAPFFRLSIPRAAPDDRRVARSVEAVVLEAIGASDRVTS